MKKMLYYLMMIAGALLVGLYSYVFYSLSSSHPLIKYSIFVEPMFFSALLILLGILLFGSGLWFNARLKKSTSN